MSTAARYNLTIAQNETLNKLITWSDSSNTPINLTGYTFDLQVRNRNRTLIVELSTGNGRITIPSASGGQFKLVLAPTDTALLPSGDYKYDLYVTAPGGTKTRLLAGDFSIEEAITQ